MLSRAGIPLNVFYRTCLDDRLPKLEAPLFENDTSSAIQCSYYLYPQVSDG